MRTPSPARLSWTCLLTIVSLAAATSAQKKEPPDDGSPVGPKPTYKKALRVYHERIKRKSLMKRTEGRMILAYTGDPRALALLTGSYKRTEAPKDQNRYLLVGIILRYFDAAAFKEQFAAWRNKNRKPRDAWLWFWTLQPKWMASHRSECLALATGRNGVFLRAAALEALARRLDGKDEAKDVAKVVAGLLAAPPSNPLERAVLLESCAAVVLAQKAQVRTATWKPICAALIDTLADERLEARSKLVLSRHFAVLFDTPNLGFEPRIWRGKLDQGKAPERRAGGTSAAFFGVRSLGTRICYVIDASDSMLKRVTNDEITKLKAAVTGLRKKRADKSVPIEKRLPWDKIRTRFDLAREYLKLSLRDLDKSKSFCVIMFGDEAQPLAATPKLVPASKRVIRKAIAELDEIQGRKTNNPQRPDGILRGQTNLHGGLLQAFRMTRANVLKKEEHVSRKGFTAGCDTIYLLSDGAPSWDSFGALDKRDPEDGVADPESGRTFRSEQRQGYYWGPYGRKPHRHMMDDFQRLNLFRKVQIHCVGIGEANDALLDGIAKLGLGKVVKVTRPGPK